MNKRKSWLVASLAVAVVFTFVGSPHTSSAQQSLVEPYLIEGKLSDGAAALTRHLADNPTDDDARFGLGALQFLQAVEHLGQTMHDKGARSPTGFLINEGVPLFRMPLPRNPDPEEVTYAQVRDMLQRFIDDLAEAEQTLAKIESPGVKLPLRFGKIKLDFNGDGIGGDDEALWKVYAVVNAGARRVSQEGADRFVIAFDKADVHWLRGYCHLLSAIAEFTLAMDFEPLYNASAQLFFAKPAGVAQVTREVNDGLVSRVLDEVALLHTLSFEVVEPERLKKAHGHLQQVIAQSRLTWAAIDAEMDDDREWIPGVDQTGVVPGVRITAEMIETWKRFLTEMEDILDGDLLVPFWRTSDEPWGVNLHRAFHEAKHFDAVLWATGTGAVPYLERGPLSEPATWQRFQEVFRGEFIGFAIWFN